MQHGVVQQLHVLIDKHPTKVPRLLLNHLFRHTSIRQHSSTYMLLTLSGFPIIMLPSAQISHTSHFGESVITNWYSSEPWLLGFLGVLDTGV